MYLGGDIITPNMNPFSTPMEEDEDRVYNPSQPYNGNTMNQSFIIKTNDTSVLGSKVSAGQELWHHDSTICTP